MQRMGRVSVLVVTACLIVALDAPAVAVAGPPAPVHNVIYDIDANGQGTVAAGVVFTPGASSAYHPAIYRLVGNEWRGLAMTTGTGPAATVAIDISPTGAVAAAGYRGTGAALRPYLAIIRPGGPPRVIDTSSMGFGLFNDTLYLRGLLVLVGKRVVSGAERVGIATMPRGFVQWAGFNVGRPAVLNGVDGKDSANIWAVGQVAPPGSTAGTAVPTDTFAVHWNGTRWRQVATPGTRNGFGTLDAVRVLNANEAWAVGANIATNRYQTLIERWNGHAWRVVPSPDMPGVPNELHAITGKVNDLWAAGSYGTYPRYPLLMHWDGSSWSIVPVPFWAGSDQSTYLTSVIKGGGATRLTGYFESPAGNRNLIARKTPTGWVRETVPNQ